MGRTRELGGPRHGRPIPGRLLVVVTAMITPTVADGRVECTSVTISGRSLKTHGNQKTIKYIQKGRQERSNLSWEFLGAAMMRGTIPGRPLVRTPTKVTITARSADDLS